MVWKQQESGLKKGDEMPTNMFDKYGIKIKKFYDGDRIRYQVIIANQNVCLSEMEFRDFILSFCYCSLSLLR